jgi:hypothetical protein
MTRYGLEVPDVNGVSFSISVETSTDAHRASCTTGTVTLSWEQSGRNMVITHLLLMSGSNGLQLYLRLPSVPALAYHRVTFNFY